MTSTRQYLSLSVHSFAENGVSGRDQMLPCCSLERCDLLAGEMRGARADLAPRQFSTGRQTFGAGDGGKRHRTAGRWDRGSASPFF
jgi:hypothetical protein